MKFSKFEDMPMVLCVEDIADTLMIGRNKAYSLVNSGVIKALKVGNHYRVPREAFRAFIEAGLESA